MSALPIKPTVVDTPKVACDGGDGNGHPRVFLTMANGHVTCPYCGKEYVLAAGAHAAAH